MPTQRQKTFVSALYPIAREVCLEYSKNGVFIPPVGCLAQAAQETGWNIKPKNGIFFGIKTNRSMAGPTVTIGTWEDGPGGVQRIRDSFLAFQDFASACRGYCEFLTNNRRYWRAITQNQSIPERFLFFVRYTEGGTGADNEVGYATDRRYYNMTSAHVQTILEILQELGIPE
jgi:flagellum-specific peptidoglycan hydrolase FlgJ